MKNKFLIALAVFGIVFVLGMTKTLGAELTLQNSPPCLLQGEGEFGPCDDPANTFASYIRRIYQFGLGIAGVLAVGMIIAGAIRRVVSAGNPSNISEANSMITSALWGIALLFGSYLILKTVNPQLVILKDPAAPTVTSTNPFAYQNSTTSTIDGREVGYNPEDERCDINFLQGRLTNDEKNLINSVFGPNARKALAVAWMESGFDWNARSGTDLCDPLVAGSQRVPVSFGFLQINISAHVFSRYNDAGTQIETLNCANQGFDNPLTAAVIRARNEGRSTPSCKVINQNVYNICSVAAVHPLTNLKKAALMTTGGADEFAWRRNWGGMNAWGALCGFEKFRSSDFSGRIRATGGSLEK